MHHIYKFSRAMVWLGLAAVAVYTVCFILILLVNPPFVWRDMADFAAYVSAYPQIWKYLGMAAMIVFSGAYVALIVCAGETAGPERAVASRLAALFALAFMVCISINYFVQITATRLQMAAGQTEGLLQFTQSYGISALAAINMLGWTLFFGLSSLMLAVVLWRDKAVRIAGIATREEDASLYAAFGVMGGFMQPQGHVQVLSALLDDGLDPQAALDRARFCIEGGQPGASVALEDGIPQSVLAALAGMGHTVRPVSGFERSLFGRGQIILRERLGGVLGGGSDPRADGCALGF